jgi:L-lactate dehydrogenase complex protein LldG
MTQRSTIFAKIAAATGALQDKAPYPQFSPEIVHSPAKLAGADLWEIFCRNLKYVNGRAITAVNDLAGFLKQHNQLHGYCDPTLHDLIGAPLAAAGLTVENSYDRNRYEDYQFGITRGTGAIAESGTLIIDDDLTSHRLAALSPWTHIALIKRHEIHRSIPDALAALGNSPNVIWCTGPSKTADVEGILIEGVHGPGEQIILCLD